MESRVAISFKCLSVLLLLDLVSSKSELLPCQAFSLPEGSLDVWFLCCSCMQPASRISYDHSKTFSPWYIVVRGTPRSNPSATICIHHENTYTYILIYYIYSHIDKYICTYIYNKSWMLELLKIRGLRKDV